MMSASIRCMVPNPRIELGFPQTWEEHLATLMLILTRLLAAGLSVNFANCIIGSFSQEILGMIIDSTDLHLAPSRLEAITRMPRPQAVDELRTFLGLTSYFR